MFPREFFNEDLIQQGYGECQTYAEEDKIELHLSNGILVLMPDGKWKWEKTEIKTWSRRTTKYPDLF